VRLPRHFGDGPKHSTGGNSPKAHPPLKDLLISINVSLVSLSFILGYEGEGFCGR
jgi:hypothetical protein